MQNANIIIEDITFPPLNSSTLVQMEVTNALNRPTYDKQKSKELFKNVM